MKDNQPHGLGKWEPDDGNEIVEGEWKDGLLNGKVVRDWHGYREEFEAKDAKKNGKCIAY